MPKRKTLEELKREEERLKELIAKRKQRLMALRKKIKEEKRKREARFLIAIGRTLLKYGQEAKAGGEPVIVLPLNNEAFKQAFKDYLDIVNDNPDFAKWLRFIEITGGEEGERREGREGEG